MTKKKPKDIINHLSPEDASEWVKQHPKVAVLKVGEAYCLVRDIFIDPLLDMFPRSE